MLALFEEERRQVELLLDSALARNREHERQQVERDGLLAGREERGEREHRLSLELAEGSPVLAIACQVDRGRVPRAEAFRLPIQTKREGVAQAAARRSKPFADGHDADATV